MVTGRSRRPPAGLAILHADILAEPPVKTMLALLLLIPCLALMVLVDVVPAVMKATATRVHAEPASVAAHGREPVDPRFAAAAREAGELARRLVADGNLPGLSVAVGVDGELAWAAGFGWADIAQRKPATPDTQYRIGTASQALTSAGVGLLVQHGRLDLDAPVQRYVPGFPLKAVAIPTALDLPAALYSLLPERPGGGPVSTRQAMAHTAGFRGYRFEEDFMPHQHCDSLAQGLELFASHPLEFAPGTGHDYSPYGWILVSAVVEAAAGEPFAGYMERAVFAPLGMHATRLDDGSAIPQRAPFYWPRANEDTSYGLEHPGEADYSCFAGANQYLSTPSDLVRFGMAMDAQTLLDADTNAALHTPVVLPSGESTGFGLGWRIRRVPFGDGETLRIGHPGVAVGGMTVFQRYPEQGVVVAVSSNVTFVDLAPFARQVAELFAARSAAGAGTAGRP